MSRGYRKVITGGAEVAARYFQRADRMFESFPEKGEARRSYRDFSIVILCKQDVEGTRRAIFIPQGRILFIHPGPLTKYTGGPNIGKTFIELVRYLNTGERTDPYVQIDISEFEDDIGANNQQDVLEFIDGRSWLFFQADYIRYGACTPLTAQYLLTKDASGNITAGEKVPLNYQSIEFNYGGMLRGEDRYFFYEADFNDQREQPNAAFSQRLYDFTPPEKDGEQIISFIGYLPPLQSGTTTPQDMNWPPGGFLGGQFSYHGRNVGNKIYLAPYIAGNLGAYYREIYELDVAVGLSYRYTFYNPAGSSRENIWVGFIEDYVTERIGFSSWEHRDSNGDPGTKTFVYVTENASDWSGMDTEHFVIEQTGLLPVPTYRRDSYVWFVAEELGTLGEDNYKKDVYGIGLAATAQVGAVLLRYLDEDDNEHIEKIYETPTGYVVTERMELSQVNPAQIVLGQKRYSDGLDESLILVDVLRKTDKTIDTERSSLYNSVFI